MSEIGIDISSNRSKHIDEFRDDTFDLAVTVCDGANEICPFFPGAKNHEHAGFHDPSAYKEEKNDMLAAFRTAREDITRYVRTRFEEI
jgi:arsenate reductase